MIIKAFATKQEYFNHLRDPDAPVNLISADDAVGGITYTCPFCGGGLFVKTSSNGVFFYSCYSGQPHTNKICIQLSNRRDVVDTNIPGFDLDHFFEALLKPEREHANPLTDDIDNPDGGDDRLQDIDILSGDEEQDNPIEGTEEINDNSNEDDADTIPWPDDDEDTDQEHIHVQVVPAGTIRDILDLGYHRMPGDAIINNEHQIRVSDVIFALPTMQRLIDDPSLLDQHYKIVEMRATMHWDHSRTIVCQAFRKDDAGEYKHVYFYLKAKSKRQYDSLLKKLFIKNETDKGNSASKRRHNFIYVGGFWARNKKDYDFKGQKSPGFHTDIVNITKQVYCRSDDRV